MRALSTRVSHSHLRCCYLIPCMDVPDWRSWNSDLVCTREPYDMPHGPSSNLSLSRERCLVASLLFVRQDKSGRPLGRMKFCSHVCLPRSESHCGKHWWPCNPWNHLCTVRRVPCIHASRIVYPRKSIVHHTLPSLSSMCDVFDLFTGYPSARGRIVEATFHLPMHKIK